jgi:hypothetical protein
MNNDVIQELTELKKFGGDIPLSFIKSVHDMDLSEYENMSVSEIADMLLIMQTVS